MTTLVVLIKDGKPKGIVTPVQLFKMNHRWWDISVDIDVPTEKYESGEINITNIGSYLKESMSLVPQMF